MTESGDGAAPHLTPRTLVGRQFAPDAFGDIRVALIGYCPPPAVLGKYHPIATTRQYFIHVAPGSVKRISHDDIEMLSLAHVYGGPVSAATVEELAYYGIDVILAYGLAGGLGTRGLEMGDFYVVESAFVADGTTPHYTGEPVVTADETLHATIGTLAAGRGAIAGIRPVRAITGDAIYREDSRFLEVAIRGDCDIVNCDSSHLFAAARSNAENRRLAAVQCGVISDLIAGADDAGSRSKLSEMLPSPHDEGPILARVGNIVEFYVETVVPALLR